jgi:hypothetical protein
MGDAPAKPRELGRMTDHTAAQYRAELMRILQHADQAHDPNVRKALLEIARHYERLASWAQRRQNDKIKSG